MSRAGYADFFPSAPSVLARKAQAEQAARDNVNVHRRHYDVYERDKYVQLSTTSTYANAHTHTQHTHTHTNGHSHLTPSASSSSPPAQAQGSPPGDAIGNMKSDIPAEASQKEPPPAALLTPKATPPAATTATTFLSQPTQSATVKPDPSKLNKRIKFDPILEKDKIPECGKNPIYRIAGEGVIGPVVDPRKAIRGYEKGPQKGKRQLRSELTRVRWKWDENYIGPGPPNQIVIWGLSPLTTQSEVLLNFRSHGDIQFFEMKMDPATGGSLGVCSLIYRDGKSGILGHQAARAAQHNRHGMSIGMTRIHVELDRDGFKCQKMVDSILERKRKKQEETRRKEEDSKRRAPPTAPRALGMNMPLGSPTRIEQESIRDLDNRFSKPRPPGYNALDHVRDRPAIYISSENLPDEQRLCRHLFGRLRNFGVIDVLSDPTGFYVIFLDRRGLDRCFNMCHGDRLFRYQMLMTPMRQGNPEYKPSTPVPELVKETKRSRSSSQSVLESPSKRKRLESIDPLTEAGFSIIKELRARLVDGIRKSVSEPHIYDCLDPQKLNEKKDTEEIENDGLHLLDTTNSLLNVPSSTPATLSLSATLGFNKSLGSTKTPMGALPKFKKKVKRQETPVSDVSSLPTRGHRRKASKEDVRPLAHRLNHYDLDGSDDESTTTYARPTSRAMSTDDDASVAPEDRRKRKRNGGRTPSRLKDAVSSGDEEGAEMVDLSAKVNEEKSNRQDSFIVDSEDEGDNTSRSRKRPKPSKHLEVPTPSDSEDDLEDPKRSRKRSASTTSVTEQITKTDETEVVDVSTMDLDGVNILPQASSLPTPLEVVDMEGQMTSAHANPVPSWAISTNGAPQPSIEDDPTIILDLEGVQNLLKDDEDYKFIKMALQKIEPADIGNPYLYACRAREAKSANRHGETGVIKTELKIEGFYRPNQSGSARTEGYRKIPEAEKSMYLPHRLAVAAKRANAANASEERPTSNQVSTIHTKPVSSSRSNRVNNRRLVAELNNQKQILSGDAVNIRFNQLKKRKKPVKFARSAIHNWGLYAMEDISANDMIIEYVGEIVRQQVADLREKNYLKSGIGSSYLFRIDENTVIDATKKGGIARFINHSCTPNCTAKIIKVEGTKRIVIYALRDISENEELTYDYKFEREFDSDDRIPCLCASSGCKGFLN